MLIDRQRLEESYRQLSDTDLLRAAADSDTLTAEAKQVLRDQLAIRGLKKQSPADSHPPTIYDGMNELQPNSIRRSPTTGLFIFVAAALTLLLLMSDHAEWSPSPAIIYFVLRRIFPRQFRDASEAIRPTITKHSNKNWIILGIILLGIAAMLITILW